MKKGSGGWTHKNDNEDSLRYRYSSANKIIACYI